MIAPMLQNVQSQMVSQFADHAAPLNLPTGPYTPPTSHNRIKQNKSGKTNVSLIDHFAYPILSKSGLTSDRIEHVCRVLLTYFEERCCIDEILSAPRVEFINYLKNLSTQMKAKEKPLSDDVRNTLISESGEVLWAALNVIRMDIFIHRDISVATEVNKSITLCVT